MIEILARKGVRGREGQGAFSTCFDETFGAWYVLDRVAF